MTDNNTPGMNREQVEAQRAIAEQQIASALKNFAQQLPNGMLYLQEAINEAGKTLDYLLRRTGLYEDASQFDQGTAPNPDLAQYRSEVAGAEDSAEIHDVTSGA